MWDTYIKPNSLAAVLSKLKTQWSKVTPKDPKTAFDQNFLNTPKEPLAKDLFTQNEPFCQAYLTVSPRVVDS